MTTLPQAREGLSAMWGVPPSSTDRFFGTLLNDDLLPKGVQGGRSKSVHLQSDHFVHCTTGISALRPGDAARVARHVDALPYRGSVPKGRPAPGGHRFGSALGKAFETLAIPFSRGEALTPESEAMVNSWELTLCLDPLFAQIKMDDGDGTIACFFHTDDIGRVPILKRLTILSGDYLLGVSKMLADTYIHENAKAAIQFLDKTKPTKALAHKTNNAGNFSRKEVPALPNDQLRASEADRFVALSDAKIISTQAQVGHPVETLTGDSPCATLTLKPSRLRT